jgi:hypothetical protein
MKAGQLAEFHRNPKMPVTNIAAPNRKGSRAGGSFGGMLIGGPHVWLAASAGSAGNLSMLLKSNAGNLFVRCVSAMAASKSNNLCRNS